MESGNLSVPGWIDTSVATLKTGITEGLKIGAAHAAENLDIEPLPVETLDQMGAEMADAQQHYLMGFAQDLLAASTGGGYSRAFQGRINMYASQVNTAYGIGYGKTAQAAGTFYAIWYAQPDCCVNCSEHDGETWPPGEDPDYPPDNCLGGPNCRCLLDWLPADEAAAQGTPEETETSEAA